MGKIKYNCLTYHYNQTSPDWYSQSVCYDRDEPLSFLVIALILPVLCLLQSAYLHRWEINDVRIVCDLAAVAQIISAIIFLVL
jgi:hypothetical protein